MDQKKIDEAKEQVLWAVKQIVDRSFVLGTAGNISARVEGEDLFVITPSAYPYDQTTKDDLVVADMEGNIVSGERKPSIEFDMHRLIYKKREDVNAVIHNHSMNATVAASIKGVDSIPIIDIETVLYLGGNILVAPFAPPGSLELAECVSDYLGTNAAVLMANHGAIGAGDTMKFALLACDNLERTCQMFLALHSCGELKEMPSAYIESAKVKSFGKRGLKLTKK